MTFRTRRSEGCDWTHLGSAPDCKLRSSPLSLLLLIGCVAVVHLRGGGSSSLESLLRRRSFIIINRKWRRMV